MSTPPPNNLQNLIPWVRTQDFATESSVTEKMKTYTEKLETKIVALEEKMKGLEGMILTLTGKADE